MDNESLNHKFYTDTLLRQGADYILGLQQTDGCIPWFDGGKTDPWDHVEAAMALSVAGEHQAAKKAYQWLQCQQLEDGSWFANYQNNEPLYREKRETNFVAYIATGVWHHYLVSQDYAFLTRMFPCVHAAIEFVRRYQSPSGEIYWAVDESNKPLQDALVTGNASILKSLECAINIAASIGVPAPEWQETYDRLRHTLKHRPECFDRTWESKERYSMDWFYPILAGIYTEQEACQRLQSRWDTFVRDGMGCLCVSDEPWVTVAESCELVMALLAAGERNKAVRIFSWLHQWRDAGDGAYWTGYQYVDNVIWPTEKPTWTAAAVILAADAITATSGACSLFLQSSFVSKATVVKRQNTCVPQSV